ncbi:MAG: ATP synthase F1 subunit delta [Phycisphaeraceae bacterium]|nr:ATP synthase F1 subunit delta [Phycisphaeraceae bacterium]
MPLLETPPDALSDIYATSLFDVCQKSGGQKAIQETLDELEAILDMAHKDGAFNEFLASRVLPAKSRARSLRSIFEGKISNRTLTFLLVLNEKDRLGHLPGMVRAFHDKAQEAFGRIEVEVRTAGPISSADLGAIRDRLASTLGKDVVAHHRSEPAMIGGLKLRFGDRLVDGSIATRLRRLRDQLGQDGAARIRARMGEIIDARADNGHSGG